MRKQTIKKCNALAKVSYAGVVVSTDTSIVRGKLQRKWRPLSRLSNLVKSSIKVRLEGMGYDVRKITPLARDSRFEQDHASLDGRSLVSPDRLYTIWQLAQHAKHVPGDFAELGVYRGGTAKLVAQLCPDKKLHLFDTFEGMPTTDEKRDVHAAGEFSDTSLDGVQGYLTDCPNAVFHQGFFPATASGLDDVRFAYVHVDADIYKSTLDALEFFYPKMTPGGVMVFDDYEWPDCPGVRQALDEFLADKPERVIVIAKYQSALFKL